MIIPNIKDLYLKLASFAINADRSVFFRLEKHRGKAVRFKTYEPYAIFYLVIREDDILLTEEYEGEEDVRIRLPMRTLIQSTVGIDKITDLNKNIRFEGDKDLIFDLIKALEKSNIWTSLKLVFGSIVPEMKTAEDFIKLFMGHEPKWVEKFNNLPRTTNSILDIVSLLKDSQQHHITLTNSMLNEVKCIRRTNILIAIVLTMMSAHYILGTMGYIPH